MIIAGLPKSRAAMHLDTVFTFCDRDLVTAYTPVVDGIVPFTLRPDDSAPSGIDIRREEGPASTPSARRSTWTCAWWQPAATATAPSASSGTTATTSSRWSPEWSSATTATPHQHPAAQGRHRGHHHRRQRARPRPRRRPMHDLPDPARPARQLTPPAHRRRSVMAFNMRNRNCSAWSTTPSASSTTCSTCPAT